MDVTSLYTNIPQEEGVETVCKTYDSFYKTALPSLHSILKERLNLSFKRTHSSLMEKNYLQTHGTAMGTKMAVAFANIFMAEVETEILNQSALKPLVPVKGILTIYSQFGIYTNTKSRSSLS